MNRTSTPSSGKNPIRFNVIDLLIIFTAIALIFSTVMRYRSQSVLPKEEQVGVKIRFLIENLSEELVGGIAIDQKLYLTNEEMLLGTLQSLDIRKAQIAVTDENGAIVIMESNHAYDVYGTLHASGVMSENGFLLDGTTYLAPGQNCAVKSKNLAVSILITDISALDA